MFAQCLVQAPALLLPDDTKNPDLFDAPIRDTWTSLGRLLDAASYVIFLGHSLHDPHVVSAVQSEGRPTAVVINLRPDSHGEYSTPTDDESKRIAGLLPEAMVLPGAFGQRAKWPDLDAERLEKWLLTTSTAIAWEEATDSARQPCYEASMLTGNQS